MSTSTYEYSSRVQDVSFNDLLVEQLRATPWLVLSFAIHVVIAIVLLYIGTSDIRQEQLAEFTAAAEMQDEIPVDPLEDDPVPVEVAPDSPQVDDHSPIDIDDKPTETNTESEWDEEADADDSLDKQDFEADNKNKAVIGIGGGAPGAFGRGRGGDGNHGRKKRKPGAKELRLGLEWLARHQSPDGRWDADNYMSNGDPKLGALCTGKGSAMYDVGVSGLALLAFLGAGHTHREGPHKLTVRKGLKWMKSQQDAEGCFGSRGDPHFTYNHAIAALAMAEAYGMTRSGLWRNVAQNGINFVMKCQNPYKAWRYGERPGGNDISVSGWMVMALKSAKMSGLDMNDTALQWAHDFCKEMTDEETGRTGYTKRGERPVRAEGRLEQYPAEESESMTAAGMLIRIFAGEDPKTSDAIKMGAELISRRLPVWAPKQGKADMYYWYYATLSMFQVGGREWTAWNNRMKPAIIDTQRGDGNFGGSWDPVGPWGEDGGRVYSTALMTMCLEVYYRYPRVFGTK